MFYLVCEDSVSACECVQSGQGLRCPIKTMGDFSVLLCLLSHV